MGVNACISGGTSEVLTLTIGDVSSVRVSIALCQAKVDNIYTIFSGITSSNQEVVWLNIPMNNAFFMHFFNSLDLYANLTTEVMFLPFEFQRAIQFSGRTVSCMPEISLQDWAPVDP